LIFCRCSSTGCVEFLDETYSHSLAFLYSREEFDAAGLGQLAEAVQDLRRVPIKLLQRHARDRIGDPKPPLMLADCLEHHAIGRQVALVSHLPHDLGVFVVVEVVPIGVEDAVAA